MPSGPSPWGVLGGPSAHVGRVQEQSRARRQARRQWRDIGTLRRNPASRSASTRPSGRNLSSTADPQPQTCPAPSLVSHNKRQPVDPHALPPPGFPKIPNLDFESKVLSNFCFQSEATSRQSTCASGQMRRPGCESSLLGVFIAGKDYEERAAPRRLE
jgi:hypothetical protein